MQSNGYDDQADYNFKFAGIVIIAHSTTAVISAAAPGRRAAARLEKMVALALEEGVGSANQNFAGALDKIKAVLEEADQDYMNQLDALLFRSKGFEKTMIDASLDISAPACYL